MSQDEFTEWHADAVQAYAEDISRAADVPLEFALKRAREQFPQLLPDGLDTAGTWLLTILDAGGESVGVLWLGPHPILPGAAYIYNVLIVEARRGEGLGSAAMQAAEEVLRDAGINEVGLNVFGFNHVAQHMYGSLGYSVVGIQMRKSLTATRPPAS